MLLLRRRARHGGEPQRRSGAAVEARVRAGVALAPRPRAAGGRRRVADEETTANRCIAIPRDETLTSEADWLFVYFL